MHLFLLGTLEPASYRVVMQGNSLGVAEIRSASFLGIQVPCVESMKSFVVLGELGRDLS